MLARTTVLTFMSTSLTNRVLPDSMTVLETTWGDFWIFNLYTDLGLSDNCITKDDVQSIVIHNGGNDGWKIESVMTTLAVRNQYTVVTADIHLNKWVDGNPSGGDSSTSITLSRASN